MDIVGLVVLSLEEVDLIEDVVLLISVVWFIELVVLCQIDVVEKVFGEVGLNVVGLIDVVEVPEL